MSENKKEYSCEETGMMIFDYIENNLSPEQKEIFEEHLNKCDKCKDEYEKSKKMMDTINSYSKTCVPQKDLLSSLEPRIKAYKRKRQISGISAFAAAFAVMAAVLFVYTQSGGSLNRALSSVRRDCVECESIASSEYVEYADEEECAAVIPETVPETCEAESPTENDFFTKSKMLIAAPDAEDIDNEDNSTAEEECEYDGFTVACSSECIVDDSEKFAELVNRYGGDLSQSVAYINVCDEAPEMYDLYSESGDYILYCCKYSDAALTAASEKAGMCSTYIYTHNVKINENSIILCVVENH